MTQALSSPPNHREAVLVQPIAALKPYPDNARRHPEPQIKKIEASLLRFGLLNPILVDANNCIVAGHGRFEAAKRLGWTQVPTLKIDTLSPAEIRAYRLADNRLAETSEWDAAALKLELEFLADADFDLTPTGFALDDVTGLSNAPSLKTPKPRGHRCVCPLCGAKHSAASPSPSKPGV